MKDKEKKGNEKEKEKGWIVVIEEELLCLKWIDFGKKGERNELL